MARSPTTRAAPRLGVFAFVLASSLLGTLAYHQIGPQCEAAAPPSEACLSLLPLELGTCEASCVQCHTLDVAISSGEDDAEFDIAEEEAGFQSSDLEFPSDSGAQQQVGLRFRELHIPRGAVIREAWILFTSEESASAPSFRPMNSTHSKPPGAAHAESTGNRGIVNLNIHGFAMDSMDKLDDDDVPFISQMPLTSTVVQWSPSLLGWEAMGEKSNTTGIEAIIQEIIDLPGWEEGNDMGFVIVDAGGSDGVRTAISHNRNSEMAPRLIVTFTTCACGAREDPEACCATGGGNQTFTTKISNGDDDAEFEGTGPLSAFSSDLEIAKDGGDDNQVSLRFRSVGVPKGVEILEAWVEFTSETDHDEPKYTDPVNTEIKGYLMFDSIARLHAAGFNPSQAEVQFTATAVSWRPGHVEWAEKGDKASTADISSIVQEIIDQPAWNGGDMGFVISDAGNSSGIRKAYSYDDTAARSPRLYITWACPSPPTSSSSNNVGIVVAVTVGGGVLVLLAALAYLRYNQRRRHRVQDFGRKDPESGTSIELINRAGVDSNGSAQKSQSLQGSAEDPTRKRWSNASSRQQRDHGPLSDYVLNTFEHLSSPPAAFLNSPSSEDYINWPSQSLNASQRAIADVPFKALTFGRRLGAGSAKVVHEAMWGTNLVAVCEVDHEMIAHEVAIMASLSHPNLVQIFGLAHDGDRKRHKMYLVMELLSHGSLIRVLHQTKDLDIVQKTKICGQICDAMIALAAANIVHADLACRNVFVQSLDPLVVKVGDFGLSKTSQLYYSKKQDMIPYRWSAPEVISKGKFSEKSDVWAFGVTLWEIFTDGEVPYSNGINNEEVIKKVMGGGHLERPGNGKVPDQMWSIIESCFMVEEEERPSFSEIQVKIRAYQGHEKMRASSGNLRDRDDESFDWPAPIAEWSREGMPSPSHEITFDPADGQVMAQPDYSKEPMAALGGLPPPMRQVESKRGSVESMDSGDALLKPGDMEPGGLPGLGGLPPPPRRNGGSRGSSETPPVRIQLDSRGFI